MSQKKQSGHDLYGKDYDRFLGYLLSVGREDDGGESNCSQRICVMGISP